MRKTTFQEAASREKLIIDVLIFENGHVLHHPPTYHQPHSINNIDDYRSKAVSL